MKSSFVIIIFWSVTCIQACVYYGYGVSNADAQVIVNKHNSLRLMIAQGKVPNQPKGVNLLKMRWDDKLAQAAQKIANSCQFKHQPVTDKRWSVGQNLILTSDSNYNKTPNWNAAVQGWFDEHKVYRYPGGFSLKTGHYTQVVWAESQDVGCGYTYYKDEPNAHWYKKFYVCNYGPAGNVNKQAPYKTGGNGCYNLCDK